MIKFLSSMRFAFWVLVTLIIWLIIGALLTINDTCYFAIRQMSEELILDWLLTKSIQTPLILAWFIGICLIGGLLAISFILCTWNNLFNVIRRKNNLKSILLFSIHVLFALIIIMHLGSMLWGYKHSNVELMVGEKFEFNNGYSLELNKVKYIDDVNVLTLPFKEMRKHQTKDKFHYKENFALLILSKDNAIIAQGKASMLSPFKHKSFRATISNFYLPKESNSQVPGVNLVLMDNKLIELFFILYALAILGILTFLWTTWKK